MNLCFSKKFSSLNRFESELTFNARFHSEGFLVPKVIKVSKASLEIKMSLIQGEKPNKKNIIALTDSLISIFKKRQSIIPGLSEKQGLHSFVKDINDLLSKVSLSGHFRELTNYLIDKYFIASVFKDSKLDNWIVDRKENITMLDFDYVKESFYLQDLAQLHTSIHLSNAGGVNSTKLSFEHFVENTLGLNSEHEYSELQTLYYMCCLLSNSKKERFSENYEDFFYMSKKCNEHYLDNFIKGLKSCERCN